MCMRVDDAHACGRTSRQVSLLFSALDHFDLATAFECCRIAWTSSTTPFDAQGFFKGWEMQTGVMAYRKNERVASFWAATAAEYSSRQSYWRGRSSGEQGAATLALSRVDVRYLPLPPSFNARPYTMLQYIDVFGVAVYHGKDLWQGKDLNGQPASVERIIGERMMRDWNKTAAVLAHHFSKSARDTHAQPARPSLVTQMQSRRKP